MKDELDGHDVAAAAYRLHLEALYESVAKELCAGIRRDGLWAQALVEAKGDHEYAKALYLKYRVQAIRDESLIAAASHETSLKAKKEADLSRQGSYSEESQDDIEKHFRFTTAKALLKQKGYILIRSNPKGWEAWSAKNKESPRCQLSTLEEIESYANAAE